MDIKLLVTLLPIIFMFHDFEEIIMFEPWLKKNREELRRRFPRIDKLLMNNLDRLSTSAYTVAVLHEFLLVTLITYASLHFDSYHWWFGVFAAFSLHLIVHMVQWVVYGKYVPVIITSILALPYCIFTLVEFLKITDMTKGQLSFWTALGVVLTMASLIPAFFLASRFEIWKNQIYLRSSD